MLSLFLISALPLWGQTSFPRGEVFTGYTFSHYAVNSTGHNLNGWGASISGNVTKYFGVTADVSGAYGSEPFVACTRPEPPGCPAENLSTYHFLAGPRFTFRTPRATPFVHALFGLVNLRQEQFGPRTDFAMGFGGGVDIPLRKHLAYRILQADYIPAKRPTGIGGWDNDLRLETGLVFTFGKK